MYPTLPFKLLSPTLDGVVARAFLLHRQRVRCFYTESVTSQLPQQTDLLEIYQSRVALGRIKSDNDQLRIVMELRRLHKRLQGYSPPAFAPKYFALNAESRSTEHSRPWYSPSPGADDAPPSLRALVKLRSHAEELAELQTPKGLLLTGPPGSGKSFLIDMWFASLPTPYKVRKHYNQLVLEIFRGVWEETKRRSARAHIAEPSAAEVQWTKGVRARWRGLFKAGVLPLLWNPTVPAYSSAGPEPSMAFLIAHRLILRHWLLVFDEIQLLDVSSAGLLADVLSWFWRMGGVIVGTSNKVPDDLYKNGVQRERLEPFVEALKVHCPVLAMRGGKDWRRERGASVIHRTWFTAGQEAKFDEVLETLSGAQSEPVSRILHVFSRPLYVPWSKGDACKFTFSQLCDESLGPADYLTLASTYRTVAITAIPILRLTAKNQGRRFINLIDALYESRCRIVCLGEKDPDELFFPDALSGEERTRDPVSNQDLMMAESLSETQEVFRPNVTAYDDTPVKHPVSAATLALDQLSMFSGEEEQFAYKRVVSRLIEMTSRAYLDTEQWTPLAADLRKWEETSTAGHEQKALASALSLASRDCAEALSTHDGGDYAGEAAYESGAVGARRERPSAPRLSENHVWGVREDWGKKAGGWGKGAGAHEKTNSRE